MKNLIFNLFFIVLLLFSCTKDEESLNKEDNNRELIGDTTSDSDTNTSLSDLNLITQFEIPYLDRFIRASINDELNLIVFEAPSDLNLKSLTPKIEISTKATIELNDSLDFSKTISYTVISESGNQKKYDINYYTSNLLNSSCSNDLSHWIIDDTCKIENNAGECIFEVVNFKDNTSNRIAQNIYFNDSDFSGKYLLFICEGTTEKYIPGSITRTPYLWGFQRGDFKEGDWVYMEDDTYFNSPSNTWQIVHGINKLLTNVKSVFVQMAQGSQRGDDPDGTKSKYKNFEVRVFNSESDAKYYVNNIYLK